MKPSPTARLPVLSDTITEAVARGTGNSNFSERFISAVTSNMPVLMTILTVLCTRPRIRALVAQRTPRSPLPLEGSRRRPNKWLRLHALSSPTFHACRLRPRPATWEISVISVKRGRTEGDVGGGGVVVGRGVDAPPGCNSQSSISSTISC